tara:strand:- start:192 stop:542 length:351 start_codon:yes stop_codon:yes gene_type:complete
MKYLYFSNAGGEDAVNDILCVPVSRFRGFVISAADATSLGMHFDRVHEAIDADADNEDYELVDLAIKTGTQKAVCSAIINEINKGGGNSMITVADDTNEVYLTSDIRSVAAITLAT